MPLLIYILFFLALSHQFLVYGLNIFAHPLLFWLIPNWIHLRQIFIVFTGTGWEKRRVNIAGSFRLSLKEYIFDQHWPVFFSFLVCANWLILNILLSLAGQVILKKLILHSFDILFLFFLVMGLWVQVIVNFDIILNISVLFMMGCVLILLFKVFEGFFHFILALEGSALQGQVIILSLYLFVTVVHSTVLF